MTRPVRVAVANDYALVVAGTAALVAPFTDRVAVVETEAGTPVVGDVDVVLFDTFASAQTVTQARGKTSAHVVVYSWVIDRYAVAERMAQGAAGYLSKRLPAAELVRGLEAVRDGEIVTNLGGPPLGVPSAPVWPGGGAGLTERESEVMALITQGTSNQEIAARLFLSINSVKSYIRGAYRKIGVTTRSQAVGWGVRHGFEPYDAGSILDPVRPQLEP